MGMPSETGSLVIFASELSRRLLPEDVIGRLGGDEFAVLLAEVHGPCGVQRLEQIVHDILGQQEFHVTASIGAPSSMRAPAYPNPN